MTSFNPTRKGFTIINRNLEVNVKRAELETNLQQALKRTSPRIARAFERLPKPLREAALSQTSPAAPINWLRSPKQAVPAQMKLLKQFAGAVEAAESHTRALQIGIVDLGARVTGLAPLIARMNAAQDQLAFIEVQTPVPAGMVKTGKALEMEFRKRLSDDAPAMEGMQAERNMFVGDFLIFAESVRAKHELDEVVGITPEMLAFIEDGQAFWNYFSYSDDELPGLLVSTFQLREFAELADRPFEAAVGLLIVGQLIASQTELDFHDETRGCALDFNADRVSVVESIRGMRLDKTCATELAQEDPELARATTALLQSLQRMKRSKRV